MNRAEWYRMRSLVRIWLSGRDIDANKLPALVVGSVVFRPPLDKLLWRANCRGPFTPIPSLNEVLYASGLEVHVPREAFHELSFIR